MRRIGLVAAMTLMGACQGPAAENATQPAEESKSPPEPAESSNAADVPVTNAAEPAADPSPGAVSACLKQGSDRLDVKPIRATGTEPFWAAEVEGRCVTYSTPEDLDGTRVWTQTSEGPGGRRQWIGQLGGQRFELRARPEPGCSDGMSDKRYPIAVELTVRGERRSGCAEPR